MKKIYFFAAFLFLFACSYQQTVKQDSKASRKAIINEQSLYQSTTYFLMAEAAIQENLIEDALKLYLLADRENPDNLLIKETLLELLDYLANYDENFFREIITFSDTFLKTGNYNAKILMIVARAYEKQMHFDKAQSLMKSALNLQPSMRHYFIYYSFKKEHFNVTENDLLKQALSCSWEEPLLVLRIAVAFQDSEPEKTIQILNQAYKKWTNEETLIPLIEQYEKSDNIDLIVPLLNSHILENPDTSLPIQAYYLTLLFKQQKFQEIAEKQKTCFEIGNEHILKILFFSAMEIGDYDLTIKAGLAVENAPDFNTSEQSVFYTNLAEAFYDGQDEKNALVYTLKINVMANVLKLYHYYYEKSAENDSDKERFYHFMELAVVQSGNSELFHTAAGIFYSLDKNYEKAKEHYQVVSFDFIIQEKLTELFVAAYIQILQDTKKAKELISLTEQENSADEIIFFYLISLDDKEIAIELTLQEIQEQQKPTSLSFQIVSDFFSKQNKLDYLFICLEKAVAFYPDDPILLNLFGYSIALYEKEAHYDRAEEMLQKAMILMPDNLAITDSLSWLFYKQGNYEKAKKTMDKFTQEEIDYSEVAYHLGKIYWKLNQKKEAIQYFQKAILLNNDDDCVKLSQEFIFEIEE